MVESLLRIIGINSVGEAVNVGGGDVLSMNRIFETIEHRMRVKMDELYQESLIVQRKNNYRKLKTLAGRTNVFFPCGLRWSWDALVQDYLKEAKRIKKGGASDEFLKSVEGDERMLLDRPEDKQSSAARMLYAKAFML